MFEKCWHFCAAWLEAWTGTFLTSIRALVWLSTEWGLRCQRKRQWFDDVRPLRVWSSSTLRDMGFASCSTAEPSGNLCKDVFFKHPLLGLQTLFLTSHTPLIKVVEFTPSITLWHEIITKIIPWELFFVIFEAFAKTWSASTKRREKLRERWEDRIYKKKREAGR